MPFSSILRERDFTQNSAPFLSTKKKRRRRRRENVVEKGQPLLRCWLHVYIYMCEACVCVCERRCDDDKAKLCFGEIQWSRLFYLGFTSDTLNKTSSHGRRQKKKTTTTTQSLRKGEHEEEDEHHSRAALEDESLSLSLSLSLFVSSVVLKIFFLAYSL